MGTNSRSNSAATRALRIVVGYNLPFALWTAFAVIKAWAGTGLNWACPACSLLGSCPACGLTTSYTQLLRAECWPDFWFCLVFVGFCVNLVWSIGKARDVINTAVVSSAS